ncbi:MAG: POTRA domain-containing protein [Planctomycetota bacterium]|jgi:outer membrane protein assembly factor BamA
MSFATVRSSTLRRILLCSVAAVLTWGCYPVDGRGFAAESAKATGPEIKEIVIVGNRMVKTDDIRYRMRTRKGMPLNSRVLDEDFKRLLKMGYFSDVQIHQEKLKDGLRLRVVVKEKAIVRRILFRGNKQVTTRTRTGTSTTTLPRWRQLRNPSKMEFGWSTPLRSEAG